MLYNHKIYKDLYIQNITVGEHEGHSDSFQFLVRNSLRLRIWVLMWINLKVVQKVKFQKYNIMDRI